jgi:hypothetical protein
VIGKSEGATCLSGMRQIIGIRVTFVCHRGTISVAVGAAC